VDSITVPRSCAYFRIDTDSDTDALDIASSGVTASLLELIASFAEPGDWMPCATALAHEFGAQTLLIFIRDEEVGAFLPAPGFPQTLPNGRIWRAFLSECAERGSSAGSLPWHSADERIPAAGYANGRDVVLVLLGTQSPSGDIAPLRTLLPLIASVARGKQAVSRATIRARLARDDAARRAVVTATLDHTRHQLETALSAARAANAALDEARNVAESANRAKTDFLATMSHELRTPLNAIGGYVELLSMGIHGPVTAAQSDALARVVRSQRHLLGLINDILNLARIEAGGLRYAMANVALSETIADLAPMIDPQIAAKSLRYDVRNAIAYPVVYADREKLQQILLNLLSNAVKFTPAGGSIWVEAGATCAEPGRVEVRVGDTGQGIPAKKLEWIFEPFTQVDASRSRVGQGAGLGLAISRDLARGMSGDLTAASDVGKGSLFTLTLEGGKDAKKA